MITKKQILEAIKGMPEDTFEDIDVLLERIILLSKIESGENDIINGNVFTTEEAKIKLSKWLK